MIREISAGAGSVVGGTRGGVANNVNVNVGTDINAVRNMMGAVEQIDSTPVKRERVATSDKAGVQKLLNHLNESIKMLDESEFGYWMPKNAPDAVKENVIKSSLKMREILKKYAGIVSRLN